MRSIFTAQHFADLYAEMRNADSLELPLLNKVMAQMAVINLARETGPVKFVVEADMGPISCFTLEMLHLYVKGEFGSLSAFLREPVPGITNADGSIDLGDFAPDGGLSHMTVMLLGESKYSPAILPWNDDALVEVDDA